MKEVEFVHRLGVGSDQLSLVVGLGKHMHYVCILIYFKAPVWVFEKQTVHWMIILCKECGPMD